MDIWQRSFGGCSAFLNYLSSPFIERRHYREFLDIPSFIERRPYREFVNVSVHWKASVSRMPPVIDSRPHRDILNVPLKITYV